MGDYDGDGDGDVGIDIDVIFGAFGFQFVDEYIYSMIKYGRSNTEIIKMITLLSKSCIVYQLIGCMRLNEIMDRWDIMMLLKTKDLFNKNKKKDGEEMTASILLAIEVLKLIKILTKGIDSYNDKKNTKITKLQRECIESIQRDSSDYMPHGFALDLLYSTLSGILKYNLLLEKPNIILF